MLAVNINEQLLEDIYKGIMAGQDKIPLRNMRRSDDVMLCYKLCMSEHPELIHLNNGRVAVQEGLMLSHLRVFPKSAWNQAKGKRCEFSLEDAVFLKQHAQKIVRRLNIDNKSEMLKAVAIYDYLSESVTYEDGENAHDAWGALIDRKAVCEGISYAFCLLARMIGLDAVVVTGTWKGGPHAWNMVRIEGEPYHLDVTANLQAAKSGPKNYDSLFLTDADMNDRDWKRQYYPPCRSTKHNYFVVTKSFASDKQEAIAIMARQISKKRVIYFRVSGAIALDDNLVRDWLLEACRKANVFISSFSLMIKPRLNIVQITYL